MPNNIELFKQYVPLLDEVYKLASLTSVLDGAAELARAGANANELIIPKMDMSGLADYSRNSGYVDGEVALTNESVKCNFDRGRMFTIDTLDNAETAGIAYGRLASEFIRTKVVPELDAFRLAKYASVEGIGTAAGDLTTGANVITALRAAKNEMSEAEVPENERYLFITPTLYGMIQDLDSNKSKAAVEGFAGIIQVPQSRFYTAILQRTGAGDQAAGGYTKAEGAKDINFMIVHKPAVIQFQKHVAPKVITPDANQSSDGWKFGYRNVGIADAYENKVAGIYAHTKA